jgi:inorganic pyrophosphatase
LKLAITALAVRGPIAPMLARVARRYFAGVGTSDGVDVLIETPKGSRKKYEYDHDKHVMRLDHRLASATLYPADYGFLPDTRSHCSDEGREPKIIAVPTGDPVWYEVQDIGDVPSHLRAEIGNYFEVYKLLEPSENLSSGDFDDKEVAAREIAHAQERFRS